MNKNNYWQGWGVKIGNIGNMAFFQTWLTMFPTTGNKPLKIGNIGNIKNEGWKHFGNTIELRLKKSVNKKYLETFWKQRNSTIENPLLFPCFQKNIVGG